MNWHSLQDKLGHEIIKLLYQEKIILTWYRDNPQGWKLVSGVWSPFYINLREISAFPTILKKAGQALSELIKHKIPDANIILGLAMAGIPIATAASIEGGIASAFTRKIEGLNDISSFEEAIHKYGKHSVIEGRLSEGDKIVLIDDLVTRFTSKIQGVKLVEYEAKKRNLHKLEVKDVAVLIDREQGGAEEARKYDMNLYSVIPFKTKGIDWLKDELQPIEYETLTHYLNDFDHFQNPQVQNDLQKKALT